MNTLSNIILLEETANETVSTFQEITIGEGSTIVEVIVNSFRGLTEGITGCVRTSFDALVLNEDKTGLSMFAIWSLVFLGIGIGTKLVSWVMHRFGAVDRVKIG